MKSKIIEKAYLIFLLLLPFVHFSTTVDPVLIPRQLYLSVFVVLLAFAWHSENGNTIYIRLKNPLYIAIGSYIILAILSTFGHFTAESYYVLSKQLVVFSFLIVTMHALYNKSITVEHLIIGCIGIGIIALVGAYYHWIEKTIDGKKMLLKAGLIKSFFANKNLLASVLFLCFPFFLMGLRQSKKIKTFAIAGMVSALPILILLGTRAVLLAFAVFGLVALCFHLHFKYGIKKRFVAISTILLFLLGIFAYKNFVAVKAQQVAGSQNAYAQFFYRITSSKTLDSRTKFWDNSIGMSKENPLLGVGLGNWQVYFPKYGLKLFNEFSIVNGSETLQRPHNDFLNLLCENGILGLIAYCFIFGIIFYQLFFLIKNAKNVDRKWDYIFVLATITGYIAISFFDFPMERIEHQILLMILFAIVVSSYYSQVESLPASKIQIALMKYGLITIAFYALIVACFRFKGEIEIVKMYIAKAKQQWSDVLFHANRAQSCFYKIDQTSIPIDFYKGMASYNLNEIDAAVGYFENAYQQAPYQIQVINNLAGSYERHGDRQAAIDFYGKALQISSNFEEARLNLAALYFNEKQFEKAFEEIDKINIENKNKRYSKYLIPILERKINLFLIKNNDPILNAKLAKGITNSGHLYKIYWAAKQEHLTFEAKILSLKYNEIGR